MDANVKILGIIGGVGPESTIDYHRRLLAAWGARRPDGSQPPLVLDSVDMQRMLALLAAGDLAGLVDYLVAEVGRLERAGADFAPVADRLRAQERIDGLVLGGTELPLLLRAPTHEGMPLLDTTAIHVERAVTRMLS